MIHSRGSLVSKSLFRTSLSVRAFSTDDGSLAGRYASAVFGAAKEAKVLDQVYTDLSGFREMLVTDKTFKLFIESPGVKQDQRVASLGDICKKIGASKITENFLNLLVENKRVNQLKKIVDSFEAAYRKEKGQVVCQVTSSVALNDGDKDKVKAALQARAKGKGELIVRFDTNDSIMGGLLVKMGDAVFDFSVSSKVERLQTQLLAPVGL